MSNSIRIAPHSNREDFEESYQVFDENAEAIDLTGATIVFSARDPNTKTEVLSGSTSGGEITISTTVFTVAFSVSDMSGLDPKEYDVGCTVTAENFTTQVFVGTLPIIDGIVP